MENENTHLGGKVVASRLTYRESTGLIWSGIMFAECEGSISFSLIIARWGSRDSLAYVFPTRFKKKLPASSEKNVAVKRALPLEGMHCNHQNGNYYFIVSFLHYLEAKFHNLKHVAFANLDF